MGSEASASSSRTPYYEHPPSPELLHRWLDERQITIHPSLDIVEMEDGSGLTVRLSEQSTPLNIGASLCIIPKSTIFSHRTASFAKLVDPPPEVYTSPAISTLYLTACLLHELRLGKASDWYGWLQILPRETIPLPTFWADEDLCGEEGKLALALIQWTKANSELERKDKEGLSLGALKVFWEDIVPFMPSTRSHAHPPFFAEFAYAYSLVSSRGFVIDAYHIIGMVPFCDLFNHSSSKSSTSLLSDTAVCAKCGTFGGCEHEPGDAVTPGSSEMENDVVEMRVERRINPGAEVFSCYEDGVSNGKLLVEWGFVEDTPSVNGVIRSPRYMLHQPGSVRTFVQLLSSEKLQNVAQTCTSRIAPANTNLPGLMNICPDGRASIGLIVGLAIKAIEHTGAIDLEAEMVKVVQELESGEVTSEYALLTKQYLQGFLRLQLSELDSSGASLTERQQELAELESQYYFLRMALTLLIQERTILENAQRLWEI